MIYPMTWKILLLSLPIERYLKTDDRKTMIVKYSESQRAYSHLRELKQSKQWEPKMIKGAHVVGAASRGGKDKGTTS